MYKDPSRWAMTFQSFVALTMLDMHQRPTATPVKLMERSLYSARHCFVEHMMRSGVMHPAESSVLDEWFRFIQQQILIQADLIGKYKYSLLIFNLENSLYEKAQHCFLNYWISNVKVNYKLMYLQSYFYSISQDNPLDSL